VNQQLATQPFSLHLRTATEAAHEEAERSSFVTALVGGELPRDDLARFVFQLHAVYTVLEEATAASTDPDLAAFLAPELARVPALTADLDHLAGDGWRDSIALLSATTDYCERMRARCFDWSGGLLAHHYVRYLGDLSGGQFLGRVVARVYELPDGRGTSAYRFDGIASPKQFKDDYRAYLDALPWDADERDRVVDEACAAFACNTRIFTELSDTRAA
jgi:heme oxygenase (biliverdin-producing, ferredoxin)